MTQSMLESIQSVFSILRREIWILTAATDQQSGGLVATYVSPGSINQQTPTIVIAIGKNHFTRELIDHSQAFAAHLIREDQIELAWRFGLCSGRDEDKFAGLDFTVGETASPIITDTLAYVESRVIAQYDAGDRIYYWADVVAGRKLSDGKPLTDQQLIQSATAQQRQQLLTNMQADIQTQDPMFQAWKKELTENQQ